MQLLLFFLLEIKASSSIIINARQVRSHNTRDEQVAVCVHVCGGAPPPFEPRRPLWLNRPPNVHFFLVLFCLFGARSVGRV